MNFGKAKDTPALPPEPGIAVENEEDGVGMGRGSRRGKGRDGAGEYEMSRMEEDADENV